VSTPREVLQPLPDGDGTKPGASAGLGRVTMAAGAGAITLDRYLARPGEKSLLRFSTAGSVDDGKSTLIGRLLYDTKGAFDDQIEAVKASKVNRSTGAIDFSLLTDGLRAEREQGITIDVAYRYFATPRRKFIIADTPGHEQYTRNMATGASTVDLAVILVDARKGVLEQSRRHAFLSALLGIRHMAVAVNKMDLVDFSRDAFSRVRADFRRLAPRLKGADLTFIPVCATDGDNVTFTSPRTPWYDGPTLLDYLETVETSEADGGDAFRFPVQIVIRPDHQFRGFAGRIAAGRVRPGDEVWALPSARKTRVARIVTFDGDLDEAVAPMSVTLALEDEIELGRGGVLATPAAPPATARWLEATLVWMSAKPLDPGQPLLLRHGAHEVAARVDRLEQRVDVNTLEEVPASSLALNEIGLAVIETAQPLYFDPYRENRHTGAFILIDPISNLTLAAGMIERAAVDPAEAARSRRKVAFRAGRVTPAERAEWFGHHGCLIGVADAHSAQAHELERELSAAGTHVVLLEEDIAPVAALVRAGLLVIAAAASAPAEPAIEVSAGDSAAAVIEELTARGILFRPSQFIQGDGI
jgi:sulfate adenylyltransferase subunit 1